MAGWAGTLGETARNGLPEKRQKSLRNGRFSWRGPLRSIIVCSAPVAQPDRAVGFEPTKAAKIRGFLPDPRAFRGATSEFCTGSEQNLVLPQIVTGSVAVPLSLDGVYALVDEGDIADVARFRWSFSAGYAVRNPKGRLVYLHRFILRVPDSSVIVDHRNRNPLDCRRKNLRVCSPSESNCNRRKWAAPTTSRFKGVHFLATEGIWRAVIRKDKRSHYLGRFRDETAAARAYDAAARELHGEFAVLNFPR